MRPCPKCQAAVPNNAAACATCGATAPSAPAVNPGTPPEPANDPLSLAAGLADSLPFGLDILAFPFVFLAALPTLLFLSVPLAAGGAFGYLVAEEVGAVVGVIGAGVLFVLGKIIQEERRPRVSAPVAVASDGGPRKRRYRPPA